MLASIQGALRAFLASMFLLAGAAPAFAQAASEQTGVPVRQILVEGNLRVESDTVLSYILLEPGRMADSRSVNLSIHTLLATGLFSDVRIESRGDTVIVYVQENPIVNRVILEGNRSISDEKINEEIQAQPRAIFTRARVQQDVQRIIEVYRQSGRFGASVTPQIVELPQNRVDLIFQISEGPTTGVRRINFLGNTRYPDRRLRRELVTQESRWWRFFSSNDNYDPDRLEYDRELLRQFYHDRGYADFRVVSAVAELTPDQENFYITFTLDEGDVYRFGEVTVSTAIPDLSVDFLQDILPTRTGDLFKGSQVEAAVDTLTFATGAAGYAFVNVRPMITRNRETRTVDLEYAIDEGPRVYIERIDIVGNTRTLDEVIRRELEIVEGDAFNRALIDSSRLRVRRLGFFGDVTISETQSTAADRARLRVSVQEQPTGELAFGAGFSSVDAFLVDISISERNLRGRGQALRFRISASANRETVDLRFTEPRFLDRNMAAGIELFSIRSNFISEAAFETRTTGGQVRLAFPATQSTELGLRYTLRTDDVSVFSSANPALAGQSGSRLTSVLGYTVRWDQLDNPMNPTRGFLVQFDQDFAGFGGDVRYVRTEATAAFYRPVWRDDVVASFTMNSGFIIGWGGETIRINDRLFKGGNSFRGFDTAGIGPRIVVRDPSTGNLLARDAMGGRLFAIGALELAFPLGLPEEYGIRGSVFTEFGTLGLLDRNDQVAEVPGQPFTVDELAPRVTAGVSIFWDSPFGPIRFDFAEALVSEQYDRTEFFRFSTQTRF